MNRTHRIIFNRNLGVWQAVAEIAKARGKGSGSRMRLHRAAATMGLVLAAGAEGAWAATWQQPPGAPDDDWFQASNWSQLAVPTPLDYAIISNGGTAVIRPGGPAFAGGLFLGNELGGSGNLHIEGSLQLQGPLRVGYAAGGPSTLDINGGSLTRFTLTGQDVLDVNGEIILRNNGTLNLLANSNGGALNMVGGTLTIGNGGGNFQANALHGESSGSGRLVFDNDTNQTTFFASISNSIAVIHNGSHITTLSGNNTYTLGTSLNAGILSVSSNTNLGNANGTLAFNGGTLLTTANITGMNRATTLDAGGGTFNVDAGTTLTQAGQITGPGFLTKAGAGTLQLTASNGYGRTRLNGGTLSVSSDANLGQADGMLAFGGGTLRTTANIPGMNRATTLGTGGGTFDVGTGTTLTQAGQILGPGSLTKTGEGTLQLTAANNGYTGGTRLNAGTLSVSSNANLGQASGTLTFSGGTLQTTAGSISMSRNTTLNADGGTFAVDTGSTLIQQGVIIGSGALRKVGMGTLQLTANNNYLGGTALIAGTLSVSSNANLGQASGALLFNGGTLRTTADITNLSRTISLSSSGGTFDVDTGTTLTQAGQILGQGFLSKTGGGTLQLTAANNGYVGGTQLNAGTLSVSSNTNLGQASGALTFNGGTLRTTENIHGMNRATTLDAGGGTFDVDTDTTLTQAGQITGSGALTKAGAGTLRLTANNDYAGGTTLNAGTLSVSSDSNLGRSDGALIFNGGTLHNTASIQTSRNVSLAGPAIFNTDPDTVMTLAGTVAGIGALNKIGPGTLTLTNNGASNIWNGPTTVSAGVLDIDGGRIRGTYASPVLVGASGATTSLEVRNSGVADFTGGGNAQQLHISGGGHVTVTGSGSQLLANLTLVGHDNGGSGTLTVNQGGRFLAAMDGLGIAAQNNTQGTVTVTGAGSTLEVGSGARLLVGNLGARATLNIDNGAQVLSDTTHVSGGTNAPSTQIASLNLGGTAGARGMLTTRYIEAGINGNRNINATADLVLDGGVLRASQSEANFLRQFADDEVRINAGGAFLDTNGHEVGIAARLSGQGGLTQQGTGRLTLSAAQGYTGVTTVTGGTLALAGQGAIAASAGLALDSGTGFDISAGSGALIQALSGDGTINLGGQALTVTGGGNFGGAIGGSGGSLIKQGGQALTLAGSSNYTGATQVTGGTLRVDGSIASSAVHVHAGATLAGRGSVGSTTVQDGGRMAAGNSIGTLTIAGDLALAPTAILDFELGFPGTSGNPALGRSDRITVANDLAFDGTVNLTQSSDHADGAAAVGYYRLLTYGGALTRNTASIGNKPAIPGADHYELQAGNGRVDLFIASQGDDTLQYWQGGDGTWSTGGAYWQNQGGATPVAWAGHHAVFKDSGGQQGGTITVQGAQPFRGLQFVDEGYRLTGPGQLLTHAAGSEIRVLAGQARIDTPIRGSGSLHKTDAGTLVLTGAAEHSGGTVIQSGTLQIGDGGTTGSLAGAVANHGTLAFRRSDTMTHAGSLSGTGQLRQEGGGLLNLSGDSSSYTGSTSVSHGTLAVNGHLGGSIDVAKAGRLQGTGTVGPAAIRGTLAPGNSIGTLNVAGDLTFHAGATYAVEIEPAGAADRVSATGRATLHGGTVRVENAPGRYALGSRYPILTADGGLAGRFDHLNQTAPLQTPFLRFGLAYSPNAAYLQVERSAIRFASVGHTANQRAAGAGLDSLPLWSPLLAAAAQLDTQSAPTAFDQLSGELHASLKTALLEDSRHVRRAALSRLRAARGADDPATPDLGTTRSAGTAFWSQAYGSWGSSDGDGRSASLKRRTAGLLLGIDGDIGRWHVGMLAGYGQSRFQASDRHASSNSRDMHLGLYGGTALGPVAVRLGAAYTRHTLKTHRQIGLTGVNGQVKANYRGHTLQAFGELAYAADIHGVQLEPFANIAHVRLQTGAFSESGSAAALSGGKSKPQQTFTTLGLRAEHAVTWGGMQATLSGTVGWRHAFGQTASSAALRYTGGAAYEVTGIALARNSAVIEAGLGLQLSRQARLSVSYAGQIAAGARDHGVQAMLSARF